MLYDENKHEDSEHLSGSCLERSTCKHRNIRFTTAYHYVNALPKHNSLLGGASMVP